MKSTFLRIELSLRVMQKFIAIVCAVTLLPGDIMMLAESAPAESSSTEEQAARIPPEQLDSLVAPIALYPDPMLTRRSERPSHGGASGCCETNGQEHQVDDRLGQRLSGATERCHGSGTTDAPEG